MSKDTRLDEVTNLVSKIRSGDVDTDTLYELVLMGYKCFKSGSGLSTHLVYNAIDNVQTDNCDDVVGD